MAHAEPSLTLLLRANTFGAVILYVCAFLPWIKLKYGLVWVEINPQNGLIHAKL